MWIDFEGIGGSGKTTLAARVAARLRTSKREVVEAEIPVSARIRELTGEGELFRLTPEAQVAAEVVRPALARGGGRRRRWPNSPCRGSGRTG